MNNRLLAAYSILTIAPLVWGCGASVKGENTISAPVTALSIPVGGEKYVVDTAESRITWKGSKQFSIDSHTGYVNIASGELMLQRDRLTGGTVEVDMTTIRDKIHGSDNGLVHHLKDPDFFDVKKFPSSSIVITRVEPGNAGDIVVTGNLAIRGVVQPVRFPATIQVKAGIVQSSARLVIDRTQWGIRYGSGAFFEQLADKAISNAIELEIKIVAKK